MKKYFDDDIDPWSLLIGVVGLLIGFFLVILFLASCSKGKAGQTSKKANYSLEFLVDEELPTSYRVQVNKGNGFQTVQTIAYDQSKQGDYTVDLLLDPEDQVRIEAVSNNEDVYSYIVVAK